MKEIPRFLTMGGMQTLAYCNEQPPFCDYCKEKGRKRDNCEKLQHTRAMWRKHRDKENVEGQRRYPLFDLNKQQGKEGNAQSQEKTQENEVESINSGCPDLDGFITKTHKKKKRQRDEMSPQKSVTKCCRKTLNESRNAQLCFCNTTFFHCKCGEWISEHDIDRCYPCKNCSRIMVKCRPPCRRGYSLDQRRKLNVMSVMHFVMQMGRTLAPRRSD